MRPGDLPSCIWLYINVLRLKVCGVDRRFTAKEKHLSALLLPLWTQRDLICDSLEKWTCTTIWVPTMYLALQSSFTRWAPGITRLPDEGREAPSATGDPALLLPLQTPTLLQTLSHSKAQNIKGTSHSSLFNFGKTQCSLHSHVAKWCRDPLALGSPIQRATSHTALKLPTVWFCV